MPTTTQHAPGTACWPELATTDQQGAKKFYGDLFGWQPHDNDMGPGQTYTMLKLNNQDGGALYTLQKEHGSGLRRTDELHRGERATGGTKKQAIGVLSSWADDVFETAVAVS